MSKEKYFEMSALGFLADSVTLAISGTDLLYMKLPSLLYTCEVFFFRHGSKSFHRLELEGVTSVVDCIKCVQFLLKKKQPTPLTKG